MLSTFCPTEACGSRPAFAAVEKLLLAQWPSQEKLILAEHNWKKHKNTTITSKSLMDFSASVYNQGAADLCPAVKGS